MRALDRYAMRFLLLLSAFFAALVSPVNATSARVPASCEASSASVDGQAVAPRIIAQFPRARSARLCVVEPRILPVLVRGSEPALYAMKPRL